MKRPSAAVVAVLFLAVPLLADSNPQPTQPADSASPPFGAAGINQPFPDSVYGADHAGSSIALTHPFLGPFGNTDRSHGVITYRVAPFSPRNSEGVYGMDVWLEQQDASGNWGLAGANGGVSDQGRVYEPVNTPNPGPSPSYTFTWTYAAAPLPANTNFRAFIYVYLYNQGGGSQGNFEVASAIGPVNSGAANDPPRINWTPSSGAINPALASAGNSYVISADGQDDNGNLAAVSINRNGQPFAYAGGGNGFSGNSQNPASDGAGTATYTAWATDALGAQSPTITWTVTITGALSQAPVSSSDATLPYYTQPFTPAYMGGSGSGAWQFCVANFTSWTVARDANAGTELPPTNAWASSWMPPAPGAYYFWVARDGDGAYAPSTPVGLYTLTVTPSPPVGYFDTVSPPSLVQGQAAGGSGWAADPQMGAPVSSVEIALDGGAGGTFAASLGGSRPDVQQVSLEAGHWSPLDITNSGWSVSIPSTGLTTGNHLLTATAYDSSGLSTVLGSQTFTVVAAAGSGGGTGSPPTQPSQPAAPSQPTSPTSTPTTPSGGGGGNTGNGGTAPPPSTVRIRFNATGSEAVVRGPGSGTSMIWTDPSGLQSSPWPTFANPQPAATAPGSTALPAVPNAPNLRN